MLPQIVTQRSDSKLGRPRASFDQGSRTPIGKLVKVTQDDLRSETRSIYKLDPSVPASPGLGMRKGPHNLENVFSQMDSAAKAQILEKIQKMRQQVLSKYGSVDSTKPNQPGGDRDKMMEQYFAQKRQMRSDTKAVQQ